MFVVGPIVAAPFGAAVIAAAFFVLVFVVPVLGLPSSESPSLLANRKLLALTVTSVLMVLDPVGFGLKKQEAVKKKRCEMKHRIRNRRTVQSMFDKLGPTYTRRAYRMEARAFWKLHRVLKPFMIAATRRTKADSPKLSSYNGAKNGLIDTTIRLSAAIRYFAGGRPEDISLSHGISHTEVFRSVKLTKLFVIPIGCGSTQIGIVRRE